MLSIVEAHSCVFSHTESLEWAVSESSLKLNRRGEGVKRARI